MTALKKKLLLAWIISIVATIGSLYFSEVVGFIPCKLCWYQRILMYPQTIILGMAFFKNDKNIISYLLPISILGGTLSFLHYAEQKIGLLSQFGKCSSLVPCSTQYINWLGFITIPFLAFTAFSLITMLLLKAKN